MLQGNIEKQVEVVLCTQGVGGSNPPVSTTRKVLQAHSQTDSRRDLPGQGVLGVEEFPQEGVRQPREGIVTGIEKRSS